jgi:hypothetical protein
MSTERYLKPFEDVLESVTPVEAELLDRNANKALIDAGIISSTEERETITGMFTEAGAGVGDAAQTISKLLVHAEKDTDRLRAADMVLKVHGVFKELEDQSKQAPSVHIHIEGGTKTNVVTNLLVPIIQD